MNTLRPDRPLIFLYFFRLFALFGVVPFLVNTVDILFHLTAPSLDPTFDPVMRFLLGLIVAPLELVLAGLCIRRAPRNLIGWMLLMFAYGASVQVMRADLLPLGMEIAVSNLFIILFWNAFLLIPLYFPDGQLYPALANRWGNPLLGFMMLFSWVISNICSTQVTWGSGANQVSVANPFFVFEWDYRVVTLPMIFILLIAGILTVILRYRASRELERLQLRWLLFGVLIQGLLTFVPLSSAPVTTWISALYGLITPVAVCIAVLRYRLYDIDLIIRRTLQYGLLTVLLGLVYFGMVVLLGQVFQALTGQDSPLAVVLSTLAIVILFTPLRRRLHAAVDRRFYRQKYNSEQAIASFAAAARSETALNSLTLQMVSVVEKTVQPEQVWVWMKDGRREL